MSKSIKSLMLAFVAGGTSIFAASFPVANLNAATNNAATNAVQEDEVDEEAKKEVSVYDFKMKSIDGEEVELSKFKGKTILLVNVASRCGYTKQYEDMQQVYAKYKDDGLVVLGVPCNQFGGQEPGSEEEIKEFCTSKFGVSFPMFSKVDVNGDKQDPLYKYLKSMDLKPKGNGDISWNFEKFLIGPDGKVVGRYASKVSPTSKEMVKAIKALLPEDEEDDDNDDDTK